MKAKALLLLTFLLSGFTAHLSAQNSNTPQGFTYQAVARNGGAIYSFQTFNVRFSIRQGAGIVFSEEHFGVTTNQYGLFTAVVGTGIPISGSFVNIDWGGGNFFLQVELDPGSGYTLLGDNRLWAVPYSLYAEKAYEVENVTFVLSDLLDVDAPAPQVGEALIWDGTNWVPGPGGGGSNLFAGDGIQIVNDTIINTGDPNEFDDVTIGSAAGGDLTGTYPNPTVRGLNSRPIALTAPGNNDVLKWNATSQQWEPKPDAVSTGGAFNVTSRLSGDGSIGSPLDIAQNGATDGQVLKWHNLSGAWLPANDSGQVYGLQLIGSTLSLVPGGSTSSVSLGTQYNAGSGINLVGGTIVNTGDIDPTDDITTSTQAGGDLIGLYPNPTVNGLAGFPLSSQAPGLNQILKFNGTTWVPDTDDDTDADADPNNEIQTISITGNVISLSQGGGSVNIPVYLQGPGIDISSNIITNTGDLNPNDDITNTTPAGGDLSGVYPSPVVVAINGFSVANTTPLNGQIYKWNGAQWIPDTDEVDDADADPTNEIQSLSIAGGNISISGGNSVPLPIYFEGTGIDITNNVITNTGDTDASDDITTSTNSGGDLSGQYPSPNVVGLQGTPIANQNPLAGQVLKFGTSQWVPAADLVFDGDSSQTNELQILSISRDTIYLSNGGFVKMPYNAGAGINIDPNSLQITNTGDLDPTNELQTLSISNNTLTLSGGGGSANLPIYIGGAGIDVTNNVITNIGDTDPNDDITNATMAAGDLSGNFPNLIVTGLNGQALPSGIPAGGQILKWTGTGWVYGDDEGEIYNAGVGIDIDAANTISNTGDLDGSDDVLLGASPSPGDIDGSFDAGFAVIGLQGNPISNTTPNNGEVLKYVGGQWVPSADVNTTYNAGTGLTLIGNTFLNTGDIDASDDITTSTTASGDVSGTFPTLTVDGLQGFPVDPATPATNQVLKWNGTTWVPAIDDNTTYNAGAGISISGTSIINTGDIDASDDITTSSNAAGDVSGTFPTLTVEGLQGRDVSNAAPSNNEILKWNSSTSAWEPSADVNTTYNAGTGLALSGNTFTNTGDTDASDDITTATAATGDVSGNFPNLTVDGLQGNPVANTAPANGEVLKWNGSQWVPAVDLDNNTTYNAGTGLALTGTTFSNTGDTDASDDITTSSNAGGDASGIFSNLTVDGLQGNPVASTAPSSGQVLKWNGTQWAPDTDDNTNTTYSAGTGLSLTGTTFANTGDTDASDDITTSTAAAGDVSGTFPTLTVDGLQGNPVANTAPAAGEVLKWNGTQWAPAIDTDNNTTYTAGTGLSLSGTTFINTGDTDASDDLTTSSTAGGDASGAFSALVVDGLQGNPVSATVPANGEVLKWNGTEWAPAVDQDAGTTYTGGAGITVSGTTIINSGDTDASDDITTSTAAAGDLSGTFPTLTVDGLQGNPVANTAPAAGEVLKWNGSQWAPDTDIDNNTTYTAGTGLSLSGTTFINTGDTDASDDLTTSSTAGGDANGAFSALVVDGLQGNPVSATVPANGEVLKWNGTEWAPAVDQDAGTTYTGGTGITVSGTTIINSGDTDASDDITTSTAAAGDVSGTFPTLTVDGLQGNPVANTVPASGEVLKWNGSQWAPATDTDNNTTYTAGTGLSLSGTTFINTGDTDASDDLTTSSTAGGDATGAFSNLTVDGLQGNPVANTAPANGEVLKWNGTEWEPSTDNGTVYTGGTGITVSGTTITNSGDTDASDDITTSTAGAGDVSGTFPTLTVDGLQGNPVSSTAPSSGQVLKWNGTEWEPGTDDGTTYTGGAGITVSGTTIINSGDTDASDDITTATAAAGDVSGTFPTLTVDGLQGNPVANTAPSSGQVLKWNGSQWAPAADIDNNTTYSAGTGLSLTGTTFANTGDTDASDDITTSTAGAGDVSGNFPTLTVDGLQGNPVANTAPSSGEVLAWNGTEWEPTTDANTTYSAGTGLSLTGTTFANTGDTDASDDITTATAAAGDVSGTFPTLTVDGIQGTAVSNVAPSSGEILKFNGTQWVPSADATTDGDADDSNEIQTLSISGNTVSLSNGGGSVNINPYTGGTGISITGTTITNTGDTDASDDITTATAAAGDLSGTFPSLTVDALQGNGISSSAPAVSDVLRWNGTAWTPHADTDSSENNELQNLTISGNLLTITDGNTILLPTTAPVNIAGPGIDIDGTNAIINTGDRDSTDDITNTTLALGDLSGTFPTLTVEALQGSPISSSAPSSGDVLRWDGSNWTPHTDTDSSETNELQTLSVSGVTVSISDGNSINLPYIGGSGIALSGETIINTGDTDASDDITTASNAAGDVSGTFTALTVEAIQGNAVANSAPANGEILKWNGTQWAPAADDNDNTTYTAGTGLSLTGTTFANTGDTDASDDITSSTAAAGDVSGTFPTLTVDGLQGNAVASTAPANGEVLKWNGTEWEPAADVDNNTTYTAGTGLSLTGTTFANTGDTDASDDITTATNGAGDVSGTFPTLTVDGLQGNPVANTAPSAGEVLKWSGTEWEPAVDVDNNTTYTAGAGLSLTGTTFANTGDTDASDDITTATNGAGDVSGTFPTLTVDGIQGTAVSATAPAQTQVLTYDGTEWAPDTINSDEVLYDASVIPTTDNTIDLGSATNRWRDAYVANGITTTSDLRAKTNVEDLDYGMEEIMALRPVRYNWKEDATMEQKLGLIAQEMLPIIGEVVQTHETRVNPETGEMETVELSLFGVNYMELLPVLIKGMQEQQQTLQTQQQLLELQSKQIEQLEKRLEQLENK
ncbi:MAG: tail fiber domain-containing protein [Bacteroidota bacterium]